MAGGASPPQTPPMVPRARLLKFRAASEILVSGIDVEDSTAPKSDPHPGFEEGS